MCVCVCACALEGVHFGKGKIAKSRTGVGISGSTLGNGTRQKVASLKGSLLEKDLLELEHGTNGHFGDHNFFGGKHP